MYSCWRHMSRKVKAGFKSIYTVALEPTSSVEHLREITALKGNGAQSFLKNNTTVWHERDSSVFMVLAFQYFIGENKTKCLISIYPNLSHFRGLNLNSVVNRFIIFAFESRKPVANSINTVLLCSYLIVIEPQAGWHLPKTKYTLLMSSKLLKCSLCFTSAKYFLFISGID